MAFFDVSAVFPSLAHAWTHQVAAAMALPMGVQVLLKMLYTGSTAVVHGALGVQWRYDLASGVLQGCPLSGLIYVWSMGPILSSLTRRSDDVHEGITRACADDIGASLKAVVVLQGFFRAFTVARKVSALGLNAKKRVLVPAASSWTINLAHEFSSWLLCPGVGGVQGAAAGEVLWLLSGPWCGASQLGSSVGQVRGEDSADRGCQGFAMCQCCGPCCVCSTLPSSFDFHQMPDDVSFGQPTKRCTFHRGPYLARWRPP
jgi:hypothetical protein